MFSSLVLSFLASAAFFPADAVVFCASVDVAAFAASPAFLSLPARVLAYLSNADEIPTVESLYICPALTVPMEVVIIIPAAAATTIVFLNDFALDIIKNLLC